MLWRNKNQYGQFAVSQVVDLSKHPYLLLVLTNQLGSLVANLTFRCWPLTLGLKKLTHSGLKRNFGMINIGCIKIIDSVFNRIVDHCHRLFLHQFGGACHPQPGTAYNQSQELMPLRLFYRFACTACFSPPILFSRRNSANSIRFEFLLSPRYLEWWLRFREYTDFN